MAKYKLRRAKTAVNLGQNEFKAKGGEGSIYILNGRVYKICDPGKMIPEKKLQELAVLQHPRIIVPDDTILDSKGTIVGYDMPEVPRNPMPLAQILTKAYRLANHVTPEQMAKLVLQAAENVRYIHSRPGYLIVDLNEFNLMVTGDYGDIFNIDMNSCQTPSYPADAIMASIRDWSVQQVNGKWQWSKLSDWWSFAILSFYMFTGIHPFKARIPGFNNLKTFMTDQMHAHRSVLDPEAKYPLAAVYYPFEDVVPGGKDGAYMQWYRALFLDKKRLPAPLDFQAVLVFAAKIQEIIGSNNFDMKELREYASAITACYFHANKEVVVTRKEVYVNNQPIIRPADQFHIGFCPLGNSPIAAYLEGENLRLQNLENKTPVPIQLQGRALMSCEGRLYLLGPRNIFEISYMRIGQGISGFGRPVASVMPKATQFFNGVAIQDMFGSVMVSIFPESEHHHQIKIDELQDYRITDAKYEGNVLMVVGSSRKSGQYDRLVIRFSKDWKTYDCRVVENIHPSGINFTVTSKGLCVCIDEEEKIEIFSGQSGSQSVKSIADPAISCDMQLYHSDTQVRFKHGKKLYSFAMK